MADLFVEFEIISEERRLRKMSAPGFDDELEADASRLVPGLQSFLGNFGEHGFVHFPTGPSASDVSREAPAAEVRNPHNFGTPRVLIRNTIWLL